MIGHQPYMVAVLPAHIAGLVDTVTCRVCFSATTRGTLHYITQAFRTIYVWYRSMADESSPDAFFVFRFSCFVGVQYTLFDRMLDPVNKPG